MAGTVKGKVDCFMNEAVAADTTQCEYKNLYDFFMSLVTAGYCTRVARNTGRTTGTTLQQTTATDYYDGSNPFLDNAWAVFKFPSNAGRAYDWYIHIQWTRSTFGASPGNPGLVFGSTGQRSIGISAAIGVGGSPWAGTTNFSASDPPSANDTKGTNVWNNPGSGLHVFPRSNAPGGTHATNRQNMCGFFSSSFSAARAHMFADQDSFFMTVSDGDNGIYKSIYIGPYVPRANTSPTFPFCMLNCAGSSYPVVNQPIGSLNGSGTLEGGAVQMTPGQVRIMSVDRQQNMFATQRYGNIATGKFDEVPITIYMNESPYTGLLGQITFIQECTGLISHDANASPLLDRAVFGSMNVAEPKMVAPWSDVIAAPPRNNWTRAGISF